MLIDAEVGLVSSQHLSIIHTELKAAQANPPSMRRTQMVQQRIIQRTKNGEDPHYKSKTIDWPLELSKFQTLSCLKLFYL